MQMTGSRLSDPSLISGAFSYRHPASGMTALAHVDVAEGSNLDPVVDRMRQLHSRIAQDGKLLLRLFIHKKLANNIVHGHVKNAPTKTSKA